MDSHIFHSIVSEVSSVSSTSGEEEEDNQEEGLDMQLSCDSEASFKREGERGIKLPSFVLQGHNVINDASTVNSITPNCADEISLPVLTEASPTSVNNSSPSLGSDDAALSSKPHCEAPKPIVTQEAGTSISNHADSSRIAWQSICRSPEDPHCYSSTSQIATPTNLHLTTPTNLLVTTPPNLQSALKRVTFSTPEVTEQHQFEVEEEKHTRVRKLKKRHRHHTGEQAEGDGSEVKRRRTNEGSTGNILFDVRRKE